MLSAVVLLLIFMAGIRRRREGGGGVAVQQQQYVDEHYPVHIIAGSLMLHHICSVTANTLVCMCAGEYDTRVMLGGRLQYMNDSVCLMNSLEQSRIEVGILEVVESLAARGD